VAKAKKHGAPIGNHNAQGSHTGHGRAIPDHRTGVQKTLQGMMGIKRDGPTGQLYVGKSLAAAKAKDVKHVKWATTTRTGKALTAMGAIYVKRSG
jgi:hypothetical protein